MKKIKNFLIVFLTALFFISSNSFSIVIKAENESSEETSQEKQNGETQETKTYEVHYVAIVADNPNQFDVPEEVVE